MNSKALEAFLIPDIANEGFFDKFKSLKNNKKPEKIDPEKKKKLEIANNKYKFSTMNKDQYENFINKIQKEAESYIKTAVNKANHDIEYLKKVRNDFAEYNALMNMETGDSVDNKTLKSIKPGYFKCRWNGEYWEIIEDQEVANCCDLHSNIVEALNNKYSELSSAKIVWFSYGEGDEGCVYFDFIQYENMKKKFNEAEIATEGLFDKLKGSPNKLPEGMSYSEAISKYIKIHKYYPTNDQEAELQKVLVYSIATHYENDRGASLAGIKILGHYINVEGTKYTTYYVTMENSKGITEIDFYPPNSQTPVSVAWKTFCYQVSKLK